VTPPSLYQILQDFRSELQGFRDDVREDFKEFKDDVRRDSGEMRAAFNKLGENVQELSLSVARLEEIAEENTPHPRPATIVPVDNTPTAPESNTKKNAITFSLGGLGVALIWILEKLWP
jgi:hypothetical protein